MCLLFQVSLLFGGGGPKPFFLYHIRLHPRAHHTIFMHVHTPPCAKLEGFHRTDRSFCVYLSWCPADCTAFFPSCYWIFSHSAFVFPIGVTGFFSTHSSGFSYSCYRNFLLSVLVPVRGCLTVPAVGGRVFFLMARGDVVGACSHESLCMINPFVQPCSYRKRLRA